MFEVPFIPKNIRRCGDLAAVFSCLMGEYRVDGTGFFSVCMAVKQNTMGTSWNVRNFGKIKNKKSYDSNHILDEITQSGCNLHP